MKQIDFEKLLHKWQMGEINTTCFYNRVKKLTSDNSDYAVTPTASPELSNIDELLTVMPKWSEDEPTTTKNWEPLFGKFV